MAFSASLIFFCIFNSCFTLFPKFSTTVSILLLAVSLGPTTPKTAKVVALANLSSAFSAGPAAPIAPIPTSLVGIPNIFKPCNSLPLNPPSTPASPVRVAYSKPVSSSFFSDSINIFIPANPATGPPVTIAGVYKATIPGVWANP